MARKVNSSDRFGAEVINYGGFPMRRTDVYALAKHDGVEGRFCDMAAFNTSRSVVDAEPLTVAEVVAFRNTAAAMVSA